MRITGDDKLGVEELDSFIDPESRYPVIVRRHGCCRLAWTRRRAASSRLIDNTASGAAFENAWELQQALRACAFAKAPADPP